MTRDVWGWQEWADATLAVPQEGTPVGRGLAVASEQQDAARALDRDPWGFFRLLATLGAVDLTVARAAEPHLDAVATLAQAGLDPAAVGAPTGSTWGVFAARAPGLALRATASGDGQWVLDGDKPWCSLADQLSHALVTAEAQDGYRLFAVDLRHRGVRVDASQWQPRGLVDITTSTMHCDQVPATPVGGPGWYLDRPGFAWGGIGVAAVWFGGAAAVAGQLLAAARRREPDQVGLMHLGACDRALTGALATLREVASLVAEDPAAADQQGALLALRARSVVAQAVDEVLLQVGHGTGPAPLAMDEEHARRVADLTLYVRQHHAERDLAALGRQVLQAQQQPAPEGSR